METTTSPETVEAELTFLSRKILDLNEKLQESEKAKSRFLSLAASELNNPMTTLLGMIPHLKIEKEEKNETIFSLILKETFYLGFKIKNLVTAAQIESGILDVSYSLVCMESIVKDVIESLKFALEEKQMKIICHDEIKEKISIDPEKIMIILQNLLYNAVMYGEAQSTIEVTLRKDETMFSLSVSNQGDAPQVESKSQLFTRFAKSTAGVHGLGIGLSVVRAICEQFEGAIDYEATETGVVFTALLALNAIPAECQEVTMNEFLFDTLDDAIEL